MVCSQQSGGLCQATFKPLLRHPKHSSHLKGNSIFLFTQPPTLETSLTHWYSHSLRTIGQEILSALHSNYFQNPTSSLYLGNFHLVWLSHCLPLGFVREYLWGCSHAQLMLLVPGPNLGSEALECVSNWRKNERSGNTRRQESSLGCEW